MKNRKTMATLAAALLAAGCATTTVVAQGGGAKPKRGSAVNRVDVMLYMKDGRCGTRVVPGKVWAFADSRTKDKVRWDVTNLCATTVNFSIVFTGNDPFPKCTKKLPSIPPGGSDDFRCTLETDQAGTYPYEIRDGQTTLTDPDVEVWN